ncbi:hypothetical protein [Amycolatopsis sp. DSM 110486]|uniref:hypothetical protein n=1 Tax=Amycolatopsis sp. DSM 110486 TaxID=2865832 RepID=UPI002104FF9B|nr:hypothetical protein [Amycolatopsis sp. DSM 110486]
MAKQSGIGMTALSVDDAAGTVRDIRNDITNFDFATPRATQDVTGVDKSAMERLLLLADFSGTLTGVFNPAVGRAHDVLKTVPSTSVARTVSMTVGGVSLNNECLITDYSLKRATSGELTFDAPFALADGTVPTWS